MDPPTPSVQDFPPSERRPFELVGRELLALAATAVLYPFGIGHRAVATARKRDQRTVVLVHGYLGNRSSLAPLGLYLRARGVAPQISFDYRGRDGIEAAAIALREFLRQHVRGGRIDLVCHSLGGLIARVYLQELGGARRVDRCITLGTPHRGTYNAYWITSRVGRELRPDSPLLRRLDERRAALSSVKCTSIVAGSDNIVVPRVFSAGDDLVHVPDLGHLGMLFSPTVYRAVADRLIAPVAAV